MALGIVAPGAGEGPWDGGSEGRRGALLRRVRLLLSSARSLRSPRLSPCPPYPAWEGKGCPKDREFFFLKVYHG